VFRALFYLLAAVVAISALKSVIGVIAQFLGNLTGNAAAGSGGQPSKPAVPLSEALKKDPICGAFVAPSASVQKTVGTVTYYFCSAACRDKYAA
jgi:YHS domain-containing protein